MTTQDKADEPPPEGTLEETLRAIAAAGLPRDAIEAAVRRAKVVAALRRSKRRPPMRPRLDTNPDLDAWYE